MTIEDKLTLLHVVVGILIVLGALLWAIPGACKCDACPKHVRERALAKEEDRARRHRDLHSHYNLSWGDAKCFSCKDHLDDEPRRE